MRACQEAHVSRSQETHAGASVDNAHNADHGPEVEMGHNSDGDSFQPVRTRTRPPSEARTPNSYDGHGYEEYAEGDMVEEQHQSAIAQLKTRISEGDTHASSHRTGPY